MAIVKLAPNVPESIELRYADVKVGTYGPQIQLKGTGRDGQPRILYVPVDCGAVLVQAGAAAVETDKGTTYKPVSGWWVVEKRQAAGEKYGTVYLYREGEAPPAKAPQPFTEKPVALTKPEPPMPWEPDARDAQICALFWNSFDAVLEGLRGRKLADMFNGEQIAALTATMYIQRSRR